jgi:branched-chain amino acid transport system substrate-binding protein
MTAIARLLAARGAAAALVAMCVSPASADLSIGVSLPLTGAASGLGIPVKSGFALWPQQIAGEKLKLIILDDASDPTAANKNARRFVMEDKVDLIIGSAMTPAALAMVGVAAEAQTVQIAVAPIDLAPGKDAWSFRIAHSTATMALALGEHMRKQGVKTLGFLGYADPYGESWLRDIGRVAGAQGIRVVAVERFNRTDTTAAAQALKLAAARPDAVLVVASGSGAAMPHKALVERGYKGRIYQTHSAASRDLMRVGGRDVEGAFVVSGPAIVGEQLPDEHPSRKAALVFLEQYEKLNGPGSRNQFAAHTYDVLLVLQNAVPRALSKAEPGTAEFRAALREALENSGRIAVSQGVLHYTAQDHFGFLPDTGVILKVVNGDWKLEPR